MTSKHFRKREAILNYLKETCAHPSAETIYTDLKQTIPDLSMGTVYRNLTLFRKEGLVSVIATVKGTERFDANTQPHVHFICSECDGVTDLNEMVIPEPLMDHAGQCSGGEVQSCSLSFTGVCRQCCTGR